MLQWARLRQTISTGDVVKIEPKIVENKGRYKVFFPYKFYAFDEEYGVIYEMSKNAAPVNRDWFDYDEQFVECGDSKLGKAMSEAVNELMLEKLHKYMGLALRQGFLDGMMETRISISVSTINDKSNIIIQSEIEAINAERDIGHIDLWVDGELDYTISQPSLVEETDTHVTLRFKKDI